MYHNFINITPTVLFKLQCLIVQQMTPLVTVSVHWSLFELSQLRHGMMMNDYDITWQIITYSKISNACASFCFNIEYYMNICKIPDVCCASEDWNYNLWVKHIFPVLRKISGIFLCGKYFSGKLTSIGHLNAMQTVIDNYHAPHIIGSNGSRLTPSYCRLTAWYYFPCFYFGTHARNMYDTCVGVAIDMSQHASLASVTWLYGYTVNSKWLTSRIVLVPRGARLTIYGWKQSTISHTVTLSLLAYVVYCFFCGFATLAPAWEWDHRRSIPRDSTRRCCHACTAPCRPPIKVGSNRSMHWRVDDDTSENERGVAIYLQLSVTIRCMCIPIITNVCLHFRFC